MSRENLKLGLIFSELSFYLLMNVIENSDKITSLSMLFYALYAFSYLIIFHDKHYLQTNKLDIFI